ncbi:uncharacterized protein [Littorina saxatilis]|uniref:uncharacterized protein isoform X1 n=1 Tax=Littorina saxatilis TaxID=31220 RepID=UPI0038B45841
MAEITASRTQEVARTPPQETSRTPQETPRTAQESKNAYNYQDSARMAAQESSRTYNNQDTVRATQRSMSRATLQPAVHDFNGNIIKKAMGTSASQQTFSVLLSRENCLAHLSRAKVREAKLDDDQVVWLIGKSHAKIHPAATEYSYPVPASFRGSGAFGALQWESARLPNVSGPLGVPSHRSDRTSAWAEEVHRRHLARTARARARLSPKHRMIERVIPSGSSIMYDHNHHHHHSHHQNSSFSLSLPMPMNEDNMEDVRLTSLSRLSSRNENFHTARSRPATSGRYFDSSNGLRNRFNGPTGLRSRPTTASQSSGPGLSVRRITLHQKELMT